MDLWHSQQISIFQDCCWRKMVRNIHLFLFIFFLRILANFRVSDYNELYLPPFGTEARRTVRERRHMPLLPATTSHTGRPAGSSHARLTRSVRLHYTEWVLLWRAGRDGARWLSFVWWPANRSFNQTHRIGATAALARRAHGCCCLLHCCYSIASHLCMLFACLVTHYSILQGFY